MRRPSILLTLILFLPWGCASLDPQPFQSFEQGAEKLSQSLTDVEALVVDETKQRELGEVTADPALLTGLRLEFGDPAFVWSYPAAGDGGGLLFPTLERRRRAAQELNAAFVDYAQLLTQLVAAGETTQAQVDQQAGEINSEARSLIDRLGADVPSDVTAFLSTAVVEGFKAFTDHRRREVLRATLAEQQPVVETFAQMGQTLTEDLANDLQAEYLTSFRQLQTSLVAAAPEARQPIVQQVLALNDQIGKNLDLLAQLHETYGSLPRAHAALGRSLESGRPTLAEIEQFVADATHLVTLYENLKQAPAPTSGTTTATTPATTPGTTTGG